MDAQPRRAEGGMVNQSTGYAAAPPGAKALAPFVGLQRRVLPRGGLFCDDPPAGAYRMLSERVDFGRSLLSKWYSHRFKRIEFFCREPQLVFRIVSKPAAELCIYITSVPR